jgi:thiol-disulfide isomerase/thioredoxin
VNRLLEKLPPDDLQVVTSRNGLARFSFNARERDCLFVNVGGKRFFDAGYPLGVDLDFEGRGVAVADLDDDGDVDLLVRNVARQKLVYLNNQVGNRSPFLRLDLEGTRSNRDAVGAVVRVTAGGLRQTRVKMAGNGFQGQSEGTLHFGLGAAERVEQVTIRWPSGVEQSLRDVAVDQVLRVVEGAPPVGRPPRGAAPAPAATVETWRAVKLDGKPWVASGDRPALVVLWASWCPPCRREVPALNDLYQRFGKTVDVVGVSFDETEGNAARAFIKETRPRYPIALSDGKGLAPLLTQAFGSTAVLLPAAVLLDDRGRVVRTFNALTDTKTLVDALARARPANANPP